MRGEGEVSSRGGKVETRGSQDLNLPGHENESKSKKASVKIWKLGLMTEKVNHPVSDSSVSDFPTLDFTLPACNT